MVSTRGLRSKFSVGEKVLCYEPDPTKARVLYDSKVLKVLVKTDKAGRKAVEYLIHFQGWNSSWDRYVSEDYVLKHTDENWRLQKKLAEKAHLRPGAYLYRRDRKDLKLNKTPQKTDNYIEEKCSQQNTPASTSRDGSISCYSTRSSDTVSNGDQKESVTVDKSETIEESIMEDQPTDGANVPECEKHTEFNECNEERNNNNDNGVTGNIDGGGSVGDGINNDEEPKDFIAYGRNDDEENKDFVACGRNNDEENKDFVACGRNNDEENKDFVAYGRNNDEQHNDFVAYEGTDTKEVDDNVEDLKHEITEDFEQSEDCALEYSEENNFTCEITDVMKEILELDNELIKSRNKVVHLPAKPNVVTILESYVREYAVNQICGPPEKPRRKYRRQQKNQNGSLDMDRINRSVNICKEVADGVRIYFDFMLSGLLLYNEEREQYEQSRHITISKEPDSRLNDTSQNKKEADKRLQQPDHSPLSEQTTCREDAVDVVGKSKVKVNSKSEGKECTLTNNSAGGISKETEGHNLNGTQRADKEPSLPSGSCKEEALSTLQESSSSTASVNSKHLSKSLLSKVPSLEGMNRRDCHSSLKFLLPHLLEWQLVPDSLYTEKPVMPSLVYGAVHLARLLVILPSRLLHTNIPAKKHKIVLRHLQMILRYLEQNKDWFAENVYQDNCFLLKQND